MTGDEKGAGGGDERRRCRRYKWKDKRYANDISSMQITQENHQPVTSIYEADEILLVFWGCRGKTSSGGAHGKPGYTFGVSSRHKTSISLKALAVRNVRKTEKWKYHKMLKCAKDNVETVWRQLGPPPPRPPSLIQTHKRNPSKKHVCPWPTLPAALSPPWRFLCDGCLGRGAHHSPFELHVLSHPAVITLPTPLLLFFVRLPASPSWLSLLPSLIPVIYLLECQVLSRFGPSRIFLNQVE